MNTNKNNKGFTLIELSIVLVIIGLIIGGILTGQELIRGAGVRATMSQIIKYNAAVNTFQSKYNALPGDFVSAASYIAGASNGNGDGLIGGAAGPSAVNSPALIAGGVVLGADGTYPQKEYSNFWAMLSFLGLIEGNFTMLTAAPAASPYYSLNTNFPATKISATSGIFAYGSSGDNTNYYHLGIITSGATAAVTALSNAAVLSPGDAYGIDSKIDDGLANSGIVQARGAATANTLALEAQWSTNNASSLSAASATGCVVGSTWAASQSQYNTAAGTSSLQCQLRIRIN